METGHHISRAASDIEAYLHYCDEFVTHSILYIMISALYRAVAENGASDFKAPGMDAMPFPIHQPDDGDDDSVIFDITSDEFCTDEFRMYDFKVW